VAVPFLKAEETGVVPAAGAVAVGEAVHNAAAVEVASDLRLASVASHHSFALRPGTGAGAAEDEQEVGPFPVAESAII